MNKTQILSAIGVDYALEQGYRKIKVPGVIKGIRNNQAAQDQFSLLLRK